MNKRPWWITGLQFTGIGWYLAAAILGGTFAGVWLDGLAGTKPLFTLLGVLLGIIVAFYGTYKMLVTFLADEGSYEDGD
ncbi:MAG: AtpZ/AtpI family protein [Chloroflexi bacterium]|nr:AtpZ/AtpI family protein [Chloroflexota bacterium]